MEWTVGWSLVVADWSPRLVFGVRWARALWGFNAAFGPWVVGMYLGLREVG